MDFRSTVEEYLTTNGWIYRNDSWLKDLRWQKGHILYDLRGAVVRQMKEDDIR